MNQISIQKGITEENIRHVLEWTNRRGADFLRQYAGERWHFPLSEKQVMAEAGSIYSILQDGRFAGMVQELFRENRNVHIGRFLIDPSLTGQGLGTMALKQFCELLFADGETDSITLSVYEFNKQAQRCYEKCGFALSEEIVEGGKVERLRMKKVRRFA